MNRRQFLSRAAATSATALAAGSLAAAPARGAAQPVEPARRFRLRYAPHFGMFRHHAGDDPVDQLRFLADEGLRALEDNGMRGRSVAEQERIAREMDRLGIAMGVFVSHADFGKVTFASNDSATVERILADVRASVEVAARVGATWSTVVPGRHDPRLPEGYQTSNVIENLKRCAEICEPAGLVLVLEPLNPRDHPGLFLTKIAQAYQICRAVGSPSVKVLDDLYHQQVTEGDLIRNFERAWDEIAYFQVGDNPGRKEPTTGEIHYANVFRRIRDLGFEGIVGMEHGSSRPGKAGERALIEAYASVDPD